MMMSDRTADCALSHEKLKEKQRAIRDQFPTELTLRVHRGLSWFGRACEQGDDNDVRFILLWIAFNATYAIEIDAVIGNDREKFGFFFRTLISLDRDKRIYNLVWSRFPNEVRMLLDNRYVFAPFWAHQNGVPGNGDWEERLTRAKHAAAKAMARQDTPTILSILFDRFMFFVTSSFTGARPGRAGPTGTKCGTVQQSCPTSCRSSSIS